MTSHQLRAKLAEAVAIVEECERLMENPYDDAKSWDFVHLKDRSRDFMDLHRQSLSEAGAS